MSKIPIKSVKQLANETKQDLVIVFAIDSDGTYLDDKEPKAKVREVVNEHRRQVIRALRGIGLDV